MYPDSANIFQIYCSKIGRYLTQNTVWVAQCLAGNSCKDWQRKEICKPKNLLAWMQNIYFANFFKMNSFFINAKMKKCKIALMQQMHWWCNIGPEPLWSGKFLKLKPFVFLASSVVFVSVQNFLTTMTKLFATPNSFNFMLRTSLFSNLKIARNLDQNIDSAI